LRDDFGQAKISVYLTAASGAWECCGCFDEDYLLAVDLYVSSIKVQTAVRQVSMVAACQQVGLRSPLLGLLYSPLHHFVYTISNSTT